MPLQLEGISKEAHDEACCTYAALVLSDAGLELTAENLTTLVEASGNEVESYWPGLFAGLLGKIDVAELIANSTKPGSGGAAGGAAAAGGAGEEEKEEEKEEEEVAEAVDGAGGLFGDDDGY